MSFYDIFTHDDLADLITAYDCYIQTACDAKLLETGWRPVGIQEFYQIEYQNVWDPDKGTDSFLYMFDHLEAADSSLPRVKEETFILNGTRIFHDGNHLMCQLSDENAPRPLRNRIQDIEKGDAFLVESGSTGYLIKTAKDDAHQNLDEPDSPWIVYDAGDEGWFENDIAHAERTILALEHGKAKRQFADSLIPVNLVTLVRERISEGEQWADSFWVNASEVPTVDLLRKAVQNYLSTGDGYLAIQQSCEDFNWGDAVMTIPDCFWAQYGIYPVQQDKTPEQLGLVPTPNYNPITFLVDQDEVLIPDFYYQEKARIQAKARRPLDGMICDAASKGPGLCSIPRHIGRGEDRL